MALEGTLRDFSLADILQLISLQKKTGLLTLKSPDDAVTLGFHEGRLVSAESSAKRMDTRLGTLLVKTGCLSPETLGRALEIQGQTLQRLGFILMKYGFCTSDDLRQGLDTQIRKIAYGLFRWRDGDYVFDQQDGIDYDHEFVTPIAVESFLMEGARMVDEWPIIEKVVRSTELVYERVPLSQPVVPVDDEDMEELGEASVLQRSKSRAHEPIRISRAEWAVYELVDGQRSVGQILERTFLSDFDGSKAFYDLVSRGLVAEVRRAAGAGSATAEVPMPATPSAVSPLGLVLAAVLVALLVGSIRLQPLNPVNVVTAPFRPLPIVEAYERSVSLLRLRRLGAAIDLYYLTVGRFPESVDLVVNANLLAHDDVRDQYGRRFRYVLLADKGKYYLTGHDRGGRTDPDLFLFHQVRSREPMASSTTTTKAKGGEVIVIK